jgi:hypothetical protein
MIKNNFVVENQLQNAILILASFNLIFLPSKLDHWNHCIPMVSQFFSFPNLINIMIVDFVIMHIIFHFSQMVQQNVDSKLKT